MGQAHGTCVPAAPLDRPSITSVAWCPLLSRTYVQHTSSSSCIDPPDRTRFMWLPAEEDMPVTQVPSDDAPRLLAPLQMRKYESRDVTWPTRRSGNEVRVKCSTAPVHLVLAEQILLDCCSTCHCTLHISFSNKALCRHRIRGNHLHPAAHRLPVPGKPLTVHSGVHPWQERVLAADQAVAPHSVWSVARDVFASHAIVTGDPALQQLQHDHQRHARAARRGGGSGRLRC